MTSSNDRDSKASQLSSKNQEVSGALRTFNVCSPKYNNKNQELITMVGSQ